MKRKLRKSLSWLLTVAMVFSLFCGMIPTASAVEQNSNTSYINVEYEGSSAPTPRTNLTIQVKSTEGQDLQSIELNDTWSGGFVSMTISIQDQWLAQYEIADISISGTAADIQGNTPGVGDDTMQSQTFTWTAYGDKTTITVTLGDVDPNRILKLQNDEVDIGTIMYIPGDVKTNINVYLNNSDEPVTTFKNIGIQNMRAMNFVLNLKSGYFYGDARRSIECDPVGTTWTNQRYITFTQPNQTNTLDLYFFTFEDGVNLDFERTVNMNATSDLIDEACPSLTVSYTLNGKTYTITHDTWDQTGTIYVPKNTMIYVSPNIQDGYGFNYWIGHDNWTAGNSIYTLNANGEIVASTGDSIIAQSEDMALNYGAPGYSDGEVYLRMRDGRFGYEFYTVTYEANGGEGKMDSQTFSEYPVYIRNNEFTREGYTFTGWNTEADGSGTAYQPNDVYSEAANLILHAQWKDSGTTPPQPSDEYDITGFTKTLVIDEEQAAKAGAKVPGSNGKVTIPVNAEVKLLYELKATGKEGTNFTITEDKNVELVDSDAGYTLTETETGTTITGTIPTDKTEAVIYVTKSFVVGDISNDKLTNNASIAVTGDTDGVDPAVVDETVETDAEEGAPIATEDVLNRDLDNSFVTIHCTTAETSFNHEEKTYGLLQNGYTISGVTRDSDTDPWEVTVTIPLDKAEVYVNAYEADNGNKGHTLNPGQTSQAIVLNWDTTDKKWGVAPDSEAPVVYTVTCDDGHVLINSTEFHIMYLDDIKQAVADRTSIENVDEIRIYLIGVTGTVIGKDASAETTGEAYKELAQPDKGYATGVLTLNGYLTDDAAWKVLNASPVIGDDTVTSITIYYRYNGEWGDVDVPCTDFEKVVKLEGKLITQIYLDTSSDEPEEPGDEEPLPPTENEITAPDGILADAVKLDCSTEGHNEALYDIAKNTGDQKDSYTIGKVTGDANTGYICKITVRPVTSYLVLYNAEYKSTNGHSYASGTEDGILTLRKALALGKCSLAALLHLM